MSKWKEEEIMYFIDGELNKEDSNRVKMLLETDPKAQEFYNEMLLSAETFNNTFNSIEKNYKKITNKTKNLNLINAKPKNKIQSKSNAISLSIKNVAVSLGVIIAIGASYSIGLQNSKNSEMLMRSGDISEESITNTQEIESFLENSKDGDVQVINKGLPQQVIVEITSTYFNSAGHICRLIEYENDKYIKNFSACKGGLEWTYQLED
jgi:hypothetical protein